MRSGWTAMALVAVTIWGSGYSCALAQAGQSSRQKNPSSQTSQEHAPAEKSAGSAESSGNGASEQPAPPPGSAAEENPFPAAESQKAQDARERTSAQEQPSAPSDGDGASGGTGAADSQSSDANPFPEAESRKAAKEEQSHNQRSGGYSSSQSSSLTNPVHGENAPPIHLPARARKDVEVADYYMGSGDYRGAYLRFKDAVKFDPANLDAIYGLAQSARRIGKYDEAAQNYRIYLAIVSTGSKAKEARKALHEMAGK